MGSGFVQGKKVTTIVDISTLYKDTHKLLDRTKLISSFLNKQTLTLLVATITATQKPEEMEEEIVEDLLDVETQAVRRSLK